MDSETIIPDFAPDKFNNPATLFNDTELFDSAINARTAKKIQLALPKELDLDSQKNVLKILLNIILPTKAIALFSLFTMAAQTKISTLIF